MIVNWTVGIPIWSRNNEAGFLLTPQRWVTCFDATCSPTTAILKVKMATDAN